MPKRTNWFARALLLAALLPCPATPTQSPAQSPFPDIPPSGPAFDAVNELAARGLINGLPDGSFGGSRPMTRYEVAIALQRLLQEPRRTDFVTWTWPPRPPARPPLTDVPDSHWAADAVRELQLLGIVSGYADGTFRGTRTVSRAEFALILHRLQEFLHQLQELNRK